MTGCSPRDKVVSDDLIWAMSFGDDFDPVPFIKRWVYTRNEEVKVSESAYQKLPIGYLHLRLVIDFILERGIFANQLWKSTTKLVSKGRQLLVTWIVLSVIIYIAMRYGGSRIGIIAQKGDKSADHLERMWEIIKHFPGVERNGVFKAQFPSGTYTFIYKYSKARITIIHPDGTSQSDIHAFTQTISDPRSLSLSFVFMDEAAFIPKAAEYYSAIRPAIDSTKGKIFITSTHSEDDEFFWDMCYEGTISDWTVIADGIVAFKCNGVPVLEMTNRALEERREEYVPPHGEPYIVVDESVKTLYLKELHYARKGNPDTQTVEPLDVNTLARILVRETVAKDLNGKERVAYEVPNSWINHARPGFSQEKFDRENRCKRTADDSVIVFKNFRRDIHVRPAEEFPFNSAFPLIRGWDPGSQFAACTLGQVDSEGRFVVHYVVFDNQIGSRAFAQKVKTLTKLWFPTATTVIDYGDPAGSHTGVRKDGSYYSDLRSEGIFVQYSYAHGFREYQRIGHIKSLLDMSPGGIPMLVILNHRENKELIKAFEHEYRWNKSGESVDKTRRPFADIMDSLAYPVCQTTSTAVEATRRSGTNPYAGSSSERLKNQRKTYSSGGSNRKNKPVVVQKARYR